VVSGKGDETNTAIQTLVADGYTIVNVQRSEVARLPTAAVGDEKHQIERILENWSKSLRIAHNDQPRERFIRNSCRIISDATWLINISLHNPQLYKIPSSLIVVDRSLSWIAHCRGSLRDPTLRFLYQGHFLYREGTA
jgi:hypothetical protein